MKYRKKHGRKCWNKEFGAGTSNNTTNSKTLKSNNRWQIMYDRRHRKYKLITKQVGPDEYVFYSVVNTDVAMEVGTAASVIARNIIALYNKLAADRSKVLFIEQWQKSGENIIVLRGYDHRHLKYLEKEVKFAALGTHVIYQRWHRSRIILVLSVFGRKEEIEDIFDGLTYLR